MLVPNPLCLVIQNPICKNPNLCIVGRTRRFTGILVCKTLVQKLILLPGLFATAREQGYEHRLRAGGG